MKFAACLACLLAWPLAHAQLADPTEPPAALRQGATGKDQAAAAPAAPRLQSILIAPDRKVAVIDGETVRLGAIHRGAVLARISAGEVVLTRGGQREVLKLYPAAPRSVQEGQR